MKYKTQIEIEWDSKNMENAIRELKLFEDLLKGISQVAKVNVIKRPDEKTI